MKYEKLFLSITFSLAYFISIIFLPKANIGSLIIVMMVPAFAAIVATLAEFKSLKELFKPFFYKVSIKSLFFAILYPLCIISLCAFLALYTKKGTLSQDWHYAIINILKLILASIVLFIGGLFEEYGWRGYLLPRLIKKYNIKKAHLAVGIIWVLYNMPAFIILNLHHGGGTALLYILVQCAAFFALNYAFTYLYTLSQNVILPSVMHVLWVNINVAVLGETYKNSSNGIIIGRVLLINGQCLFGLIFLCLFALYAHRKFSKY
ncbi:MULTISPECIES: type II CAAX endopeptidase family protein [unclassified Clostridium]|uniref:CPBP family intramembrane glutamic endopeptidase n=1 Tax=unclassified Clostridium TaxID=2614128 RepID=UPI0002983408|nr:MULTISPECIES: type II CAAX endopeptidase family protein [unclassified Clostridium]EKQ51737.1 MAG: CAAX amino terminal protease family [Clostridium sp. Maddingley MBC34-26]